MSEKNILVATYGSLRLGMGNYRTNERAGAERIATGSTVTPYNLYEYGGGGFPAISLTQECKAPQLVVDIFRTDEAGLFGPYDSLEGYRRNAPEQSFYNRTLVPVQWINEDGEVETAEAWIYHIDNYVGKVLVEDGDWVRHVNERDHDRY